MNFWDKMKNKYSKVLKKHSILYLIMFLFLFLCLYNLSSKQLDEVELSILLDTSLRPINYRFIRTGVTHPPLWFFLLHFWNALFEVGSVISRVLPLIFGLLSIYMTHKLAKLMFNLRIANLSAFFLAISPLLIEYSRRADKYTLFVFLSILNFYTFIVFLRDGTKKNWVFFLLSSFFLAQTHFYGALLFLVEFLYVFINPNYKHKAKKVTLAFLIVGLTYLPQFLLTMRYGPFDPPYDEPWHDLLYPSSGNRFYFLYKEFVVHEIGHLGLLVIICFYFLYFQSKDKNPLPRLLFLLCPSIFVIISLFMYVRPYQLIFLLPFYLVYLFKYIDRFNLNKKYIFFAFFLTVSLILFPNFYRQGPDISYIKHIEHNFQEGDILIVDSCETFKIMHYSNLTFTNLSFYSLYEYSRLINLTKGREWLIYYPELEYIDRYYFNNSIINNLRNNCVLSYPGPYRVYLCDLN